MGTSGEVKQAVLNTTQREQRFADPSGSQVRVFDTWFTPFTFIVSNTLSISR